MPPYRSPIVTKQQEVKTSKESHASSNGEKLPSEISELLNYGRRNIDDANSPVSNDNGLVVRGASPCKACVTSSSLPYKKCKHDIILNELIRKSEHIQEKGKKVFDSMEELNASDTRVTITGQQHPQHAEVCEQLHHHCCHQRDDHQPDNLGDHYGNTKRGEDSDENTIRVNETECCCCCHGNKLHLDTSSQKVKTKHKNTEKGETLNDTKESSDDSLPAVLKEVVYRITNTGKDFKKTFALPTLPNNETKFILLKSPDKKKVKIGKH